MIRSMTGYGKGIAEGDLYRVQVELRSVNGKHLDLIVRLPKNLLELEDVVRDEVRSRLQRGRVEAFIQVEPLVAQLKAPRINPALARYYWQELQQLHLSLPGSEPPRLEHLLRMPGLFESPDESHDVKQLGLTLRQATQTALEQLVGMRSQEGNALARDILERVEAIEKDAAVVAERQNAVQEELAGKLKQKIQTLLQDLGGDLDENRLLQEVAYMLDRMDINEELVRLQSHLGQIRDLITGDGAAEGRRLDFLTQELHREVNTIGSKTNDLGISQAVVRMKNEIGKLKEQVQNIE
ncbi:MAG: YicC family protein [Desulfacinum sp.]|nr:YicC family protein [Desulfacinum sp.]